MRALAAIRPSILAIITVLLSSAPAVAQDPPPRIGPFVVDVRGSFPGLPDDPALADSRGMAVAELPGRGPGLEIGAHVYPLRWKAMTIGLGGQLFLIARVVGCGAGARVPRSEGRS